MPPTDFNTPIPRLLSRHLAGDTLSEQERALLTQWLEADPKNRALHKKMLSGLALTEYNAIRSLANTQIHHKNRQQQRRKRTITLISSIAGTAAAAILFTLFLIHPTPDPNPDTTRIAQILSSSGESKALLSVAGKEIALTEKDDEVAWIDYVAAMNDITTTIDEPAMVRITVPRGGEYQLRLPDSTRVWLNAQTVIEYAEKFVGTERRVHISGEAFFDVTHHPTQPFIVTTFDNLEITVRGTKFNVNNYADRNNTVIALVEGSVTVRNDTECVTLAPNYVALFDRTEERLTVSQVTDLKTYTAWTQGQFYYHGTSLDAIITALERWYDVEIEYHHDLIGSTGEATLIFNRKDNLHSVLESLTTMTGMKYHITDNIIYMTL